MTDAAEKTTEVVAEAAEFVSEQAADFARFARELNKVKVQFGLLGTVVGAAAAGFVAYKIAYSRAEKKYSDISANEVAEMREHYRARGQALEEQAGKKELAELVAERGYVVDEVSVDPPMSVKPPMTLGVEAPHDTDDDSEMAEDDVEGPDGVKPEAVLRNIFKEAKVTHEWDWHEERKRRDPSMPYVIHVDEKDEMVGYDEVSLTYYGADDVLSDDDGDRALGENDRERLIGEKNLERFGHGSGDANIVLVRNDELEIVYVIVKSPNSYAEEVHGLRHSDYDRGNLKRMRARERADDR